MNPSPLIALIEEELEKNHLLRTQLSSVKDQLIDLSTSNFYQVYTPQNDWFQTTPSLIHGISHLTRVLVLTELISQQTTSQNVKLDQNALRWAAITHDTQRIDDYTDSQHGDRSSQWFLDNFIDLKDVDITKVAYLNKWHVPQDNLAPIMTPELAIFKDADGLDRWRVGSLNPNYLRTTPGKNLTQFSKWLFYISCLLKRDYNQNCHESVIEAVKILSKIQYSNTSNFSQTPQKIEKMFHYTTTTKWRKIQRGDHIFVCQDNDKPNYALFKGLVPHRRVVSYGIPNMPQQAHEGGIWGFLEPQPQNWIQSSEFADTYSRLIDHISFGNEKDIVILEIKLAEQDQAVVIDWAHVQKIYDDESTNSQDMNNCWKKYWDSRVPLCKYDGTYTLPEVVVQNRIELDRISLMPAI